MAPPTLIAVSPVPLVVTWLLTYLLHSSVILGAVWLVTRSGRLSAPRHRASLWKIGALAGPLTASVQVGLASLSPVASTGSRPPAAGRLGAHHPTWTARCEDRSGEAATLRQVASIAADSPACELALTRHVQQTDSRLRAPSGLGDGALEVEALVDRWGDGRTARWPGLLLGLWALGALVGGGSLLLRRIRLNRALHPWRDPPVALLSLLAGVEERAGMDTPLRLLEAPGLGSPVALSGRRIALPTTGIDELNRGELAAVLAHEVGHLVRRDPAWLRALSLLEAILWVQPLNRPARRAFQLASDFLADDWAVRCTGSRLALARALEKVSRWAVERGSPRGVLAMARPESPMVERVRVILETPLADSARAAPRWNALLLLPALFLPPVSVAGPEAVQVLVVRQVRHESLGAPVDGESGPISKRIEVRVFELSEPPPG